TATGTAEGKKSRHSVGKIVASDCRSSRETRADNLVFESARVFHVAAMQQLRRGAQLPELQCSTYISSTFSTRWIASPRRDDVRPLKLSFVWAHRSCSKKMSRVRTRRTDLSRLRYRESGINRCPNFPES